MKKISIVFLPICLMLLCACGGASSSDKKSVKEKAYKYASMKDGVLHLDLKEARKHQQEVKLSDICDSLIYIPLETKKECLLGKNASIRIDGDDVFCRYSRGLYHFNTDGTFIGQIGKIGRGPGEFICTCFCINRRDKRIYIYANYKHRIFEYDYNGKLLSNDFTLGDNIVARMLFSEKSNSIINSSSYILKTFEDVKNTSDYNILNEKSLNSKICNTIKSKYYPKEYELRKANGLAIMHGSSIFKHNGKIRVQEIASDTLFEYRKKALHPVVILNNKEFKPKFTYDVYDEVYGKTKWNSEERRELRRKLLYSSIREESSRYIFVGDSEKYLYDKKERELVCLDASSEDIKIKNDIDGVIDMWPVKIIDGKYMLCVIDASTFLENTSQISLDNKENLKEIVSNMKEESNPILMLARLKK